MAQANIKAVITAEDRASASLATFGNNVSSLGGKIASTMKVAVAAFAAATVAVGTLGLKSAADFEQTRIGLENMLGSADKARSLLSQISKFAADTPFEFPELAQATRQLVAFGFSAEDAFDTMKQLGDVSAAVGAPINDLAYLMGTLRTQGRAFTIDIRQFAQRGIPIYEYLAKVLNTNEQAITEMIEAGKIGFPEVQKAFQAMTSEGGKFYNTMEKQSKSLSGQFSTLKDNLGLTLRELVGISQTGDIIEGSFFDKVTTGIGALNQQLPNLSQKFKELLGGVAEVASQVGAYLTPKLVELYKVMQEDLFPIMQQLWTQVISPLAQALGGALVVAIGGLIDAWKNIISILAPVYKAMLDIWNAALVLLAPAFQALWETIKSQLIPALRRLWEQIGPLLEPILKVLAGTIFGVVLASLTSFAVTLNALIWVVSKFIDWISFNIRMVRDFASVLMTAFQPAIGIVSNVFNAIRQVMTAPIEQARNIIASIADQIANVISGITSRINSVKDSAQSIGATLKSKIPGFAGGTNNAPRGLALVGENGPELVRFGGGEQVIPANRTAQLLSQPTGSTQVDNSIGQINLNVNVGMYTGSEIEKRKVAQELFNALQDIAISNGTSVARMMG